MRFKEDEPTIRCGYCNRKFPVVQRLQHWTASLCNLRWMVQR
jgi:hypothetical protein